MSMLAMDVLPEPSAPRSAGRRLPLLVAVIVVLIAAVGGLMVVRSSSAAPANAATVVRATAAHAQAAGSSSVDITMTIRTAGRTVTANGTGAFDYRRRAGMLDLQVPNFGDMQEVLTPKAIYVRMPDGLSNALAPGGKPWFELRFSALKAQGIDVNKLMSASPTGDPSSMLRTLANAVGIRRVGGATVDGVHATHYAAATSMLDLLRAEGLPETSLQGSTQFGASVIHFDVWVDKTGLARRLQMQMSMGSLGSMNAQMDFANFGEPVTVVVPPQAIVTDIS
jgi:hypothetical protein